ncbi:MAG: archaeosortase/exosortase family protein, partial [Candidatus Nanohaloarchaea archaeon]
MARGIPDPVTAAVERVRERYAAFRDRLTPRQQRLLQVFTFLTKFTVLAAPFWLVLYTGWESSALRAVTADAAATVLRTIGIDASATGSLVSTGEMLLDVTWDSTGWKSVTVFLALVAASHRPLRSKAAAAVARTAALLVVNVAR